MACRHHDVLCWIACARRGQCRGCRVGGEEGAAPRGMVCACWLPLALQRLCACSITRTAHRCVHLACQRCEAVLVPSRVCEAGTQPVVVAAFHATLPLMAAGTADGAMAVWRVGPTKADAAYVGMYVAPWLAFGRRYNTVATPLTVCVCVCPCSGGVLLLLPRE